MTIGDILYFPLKVEEANFPDLQYEVLLVKSQPADELDGSEESTDLKIRLKNPGSQNWPSNTKLYQVNKPILNVFFDSDTGENVDGEMVGECKSGGLKMLDFEIKIPKLSHSQQLDLRLGTGPKGPFFGPVMSWKINV